ncbi:MAG: hypothetical protein ACK5MZ_06185 [Aestuariibaculum sp.]
MKFWIVALFMGFAFLSQAQQIEVQGETFHVKGKTFLKNGEDVTESLSLEKKTEIRNALDKQKEVKKVQEQTEKAREQAEKAQKKAEKTKMQAEKAEANYNKAQNKHSSTVSKYEKLKNKGKLSPVDEEKWLKKIDKLDKNVQKTRKKLR